MNRDGASLEIQAVPDFRAGRPIGPLKEEQMSASAFRFDHREGTVRVIPEGDRIVAVCLDGEFDLANAPALGDQVDDALASGSDLILDLSEATFIDSSVIRVLFEAARAVDGRDQTVVLQVATAPIVERALELVSIERVLPRAHDREEAIQMISRRMEASRS